jgi:hypothetical protein
MKRRTRIYYSDLEFFNRIDPKQLFVNLHSLVPHTEPVGFCQCSIFVNFPVRHVVVSVIIDRFYYLCANGKWAYNIVCCAQANYIVYTTFK